MRHTLPVSLLTLVLTGCEFANATGPTIPGADDTDVVSAGCPAGMAEASQAVVTFTNVSEFTTGVFAYFEADRVYNGQPAACVDADGTRADVVMIINDLVAGVLSVETTSPGSVPLAGVTSTDADTLSFVSSDAYFNSVWTIDDWTQGTMNVNAVGDPLSLNISQASGTAATGEVFGFSGFLEITP